MHPQRFALKVAQFLPAVIVFLYPPRLHLPLRPLLPFVKAPLNLLKSSHHVVVIFKLPLCGPVDWERNRKKRHQRLLLNFSQFILLKSWHTRARHLVSEAKREIPERETFTFFKYQISNTKASAAQRTTVELIRKSHISKLLRNCDTTKTNPRTKNAKYEAE